LLIKRLVARDDCLRHRPIVRLHGAKRALDRLNSRLTERKHVRTQRRQLQLEGRSHHNPQSVTSDG
jgi:hypothetical protein